MDQEPSCSKQLNSISFLPLSNPFKPVDLIEEDPVDQEDAPVETLHNAHQQGLLDYKWVSNAQKSFWRSQVNIDNKRKRDKPPQEPIQLKRPNPPEIGEEFEIGRAHV